MAGREIGAGAKLGRRQNAAVRSGMAVISAPRQIQGSPAGRRAPGKRSIGPVRAAGRANAIRCGPAIPAITVMSAGQMNGVARAPIGRHR